MGEMNPGPSGDPHYPPPATGNPYPNPYEAQAPQPYGPPSAYEQPYYPPPAPYGQPAYGQAPGAPAYNAYGYPQQPSSRPGQALASAVLAYILAGILILSGILLLFGASTVNSFGDAFHEDTGSVTAELAFDGFVDFVAAGLLIAGGVSLSGARRRGRTLLVVGAAITVADCVYWLVRTSAAGGTLFFILIYGSVAVLAMVFALSAPTRQWLSNAPGAPPSNYPG